MILDGFSSKSIEEAKNVLLAGGLVAFPTETVYGLGALATSEIAIKKIFALKRRPFSDPLIVHVPDKDSVKIIAEKIPADFEMLADFFWPGPLTMILKKKKWVSNFITAGLDTVAIRVPDHPVALSLLAAIDLPLVAPSANLFQHVSPTTAKHVYEEFGEGVQIILDGGPCMVGVESTVLMLEPEIEILRPGGISREQLEKKLGRTVKFGEVNRSHLGPGLLDFHYAPSKRLICFELLGSEALFLTRSKEELSKTSLLVPTKALAEKFREFSFFDVKYLSETGDLAACAQKFYSAIRDLDQDGSKQIFALFLPVMGIGVTINDRLKRAQHDT